MPQTAVPLVLSDDERAELARWSHGRLPWLAERARIVLACAEPESGVAAGGRAAGVDADDGAQVAAAVRRGGPGRAGRS